jgi:V8-like Glu-specific endopeptidase
MNSNIMKTKFLFYSLALVSAAFVPLRAQTQWPYNLDGQPPRGIFGVDDRLEAREKWEYRDYVRATASLVSTRQVQGDRIFASTLRESLQRSFGKPADASIRFLDQPIASFCTGFLIAPDILVTAGHCFAKDGQTFRDRFAANVGKKEDYVWVFDYTSDAPVGTDGALRYVNIPQKNQYRIAEIIDASFTGLRGVDFDYAVIRLDRKADRKPFKYRVGASVSLDDMLAMVGSPRGLPLKISDSARVTNNDGLYSFLTNLDAFGGNSGGPVFNVNGWIEGILVRGPSKTQTQDFHYDATCDCVKPDVWMDEYVTRRAFGLAASTFIGNGVFRMTAVPVQWRKEGVYRNLELAIDQNNTGEFWEWTVYHWIFGKEHKLTNKPDLLLLAASKQRALMVDSILGIGILNPGLLDLDVKDAQGRGLVHLFAIGGMQSAIAKALALDEFNINAKDANGRNAYFHAVDGAQTAMIPFLKNNNCDINQPDNLGESALHYAVRQGKTELVKSLINAGIDYRRKNREGQTAYDLAVRLKNKELKKYLKKYRK